MWLSAQGKSDRGLDLPSIDSSLRTERDPDFLPAPPSCLNKVIFRFRSLSFSRNPSRRLQSSAVNTDLALPVEERSFDIEHPHP